MSRVIGQIAIYAVIGVIGSISSRTKAKKRDGVIYLGPSPAILVLSIALSSFFLLWFCVSLFRSPFEYGDLIVLAVGVLGFFGIPADISVTPDAVREKFWWRRERIIAWKDVVSINYKTASGGIQIKAADGTKISHSKGNRDPFEFELACMRYTRHARPKTGRQKKAVPH